MSFGGFVIDEWGDPVTVAVVPDDEVVVLATFIGEDSSSAHMNLSSESARILADALLAAADTLDAAA